jgi:hypothetical protein
MMEMHAGKHFYGTWQIALRRFDPAMLIHLHVARQR